ncbi:MAG: ABC transporter ATP-binding protein [Armatimonadota bacterium]|nr:ABC transporter ATP-binding protein [Armatimonadota bacterium]MDR7488558.1 ABC transporter ATP-binding protein [Armatimonadota bacterium]MDR7585800.1 ABC transporter ATP-binding protein [Armatimonadota bacterium]
MAELRLEALGKAYGESWAVRDLTLTVADSEFVTLLGPSGCGKTTTLRMIAGFVSPTAGRVVLDGRVLSAADGVRVPPERRGMGMVFQSYAVWPHMTALQNVAYPLRRRGLGRAEVDSRARRALDLVHLAPYADRYPHELSGGQQQRVALARALVMEPAVLLLDEPLSNLDAKLREEMRFEIKELADRLRITVVYVTHDQVEAMVLSRRIAVMDQGRIVQVGTPEELYDAPATPFVATFLGAANFLPGVVEGHDGPAVRVRLRGVGAVVTVEDRAAPAAGEVLLCVRPEAIHFDPSGPLRGRVVRRSYLGSHVDYRVRVGEGDLRVAAPPGGPREGETVGLRVGRGRLYPASDGTAGLAPASGALAPASAPVGGGTADVPEASATTSSGRSAR